MAIILSESATLKIVHHPHQEGPSDRLIVTFAPKSDNFRTEGFGTRFALSRGYDTIYVAQSRLAWHQGIGIEELTAQILPVADGREIVAYGNSAGGYAALYFGGALNARILAIAPRNDIHPLITVSEDKTRDEFKHHADLNEVPKSQHQPVILFDPHQGKDTRLVNRWAAEAYPEAHIYPIFGTGHNVIGGLQNKKVLGPMVTAFFHGVTPAPLMIWEEGSHNWHVTQSYLAEKRGELQAALNHLLEARLSGISMNLLQDIMRLARKLDQPDIAAVAEKDLNEMRTERRRKKVAQSAT